MSCVDVPIVDRWGRRIAVQIASAFFGFISSSSRTTCPSAKSHYEGRLVQYRLRGKPGWRPASGEVWRPQGSIGAALTWTGGLFCFFCFFVSFFFLFRFLLIPAPVVREIRLAQKCAR